MTTYAPSGIDAGTTQPEVSPDPKVTGATSEAITVTTTKPTYRKTSNREWKLIAKGPEAHIGETMIMYGLVTQFDSGHWRRGVSGRTSMAARLARIVEDDLFSARDRGVRLDSSIVLGLVGTLSGVGLGSWLAGRTQRALQREVHRQGVSDAKRAAYIEYLSTMRRFRRYIMHRSADQIRLAESGGPRGMIPHIEGAEQYWDDVERARSELWIVAGYDSRVRVASDKIMDAIYVVAREKAISGPGSPVPISVIDKSRNAERAFVEAVRHDLDG